MKYIYKMLFAAVVINRDCNKSFVKGFLSKCVGNIKRQFTEILILSILIKKKLLTLFFLQDVLTRLDNNYMKSYFCVF